MNTLNADLIRQGDVLLERLDDSTRACVYDAVETATCATIPESPLVTAPFDADGSATLAHGEVTGHRHRFERAAGPDGSALARIMVHPSAPDQPAIVELTAPQALIHEEHTAHEIGRGTWRVSMPYEYTGAELVRVQD